MSPNNKFEIFLYTIDMYKRLVDVVPLDSALRAFDVRDFHRLPDIRVDDSVFASIAMRLMLQRKYFVPGKDLFLRGLIKSAKSVLEAGGRKLDELVAVLDSLKHQSVELAFGDRETSDLRGSSEDLMYGALLHADSNRIAKLVETPEFMMVLALAPYLAKREEVLFKFADLLIDSGFEPIAGNRNAFATVSFGEQESFRKIENSPFWRNLRGRDLHYSEAKAIAQGLSDDDAVLILMAGFFVSALLCDPINVCALEKIVAAETLEQWGDFSSLASIFDSNYGASTHVRHNDDGTAIVKLFPNVPEPFLIDGPQVIGVGHELVFSKEKGIWKIWAMR